MCEVAYLVTCAPNIVFISTIENSGNICCILQGEFILPIKGLIHCLKDLVNLLKFNQLCLQLDELSYSRSFQMKNSRTSLFRKNCVMVRVIPLLTIVSTGIGSNPINHSNTDYRISSPLILYWCL